MARVNEFDIKKVSSRDNDLSLSKFEWKGDVYYASIKEEGNYMNRRAIGEIRKRINPNTMWGSETVHQEEFERSSKGTFMTMLKNYFGNDIAEEYRETKVTDDGKMYCRFYLEGKPYTAFIYPFITQGRISIFDDSNTTVFDDECEDASKITMIKEIHKFINDR